MNRVERHQREITFEETASQLEITIPSRRNWAVIGFFGFFLAFAVVWSGFAVGSLQRTPSLGVTIFFVVWFLGWSFSIWAARTAMLWMLFGRELICVDGGELRIEIIVPLGGRAHSYDLSRIRALRRTPSMDVKTPSALALDLIGSLEFENAGKAVRFGRGLTYHEEQLVIDSISARLTIA